MSKDISGAEARGLVSEYPTEAIFIKESEDACIVFFEEDIGIGDDIGNDEDRTALKFRPKEVHTIDIENPDERIEACRGEYEEIDPSEFTTKVAIIGL